jgi:hypothetical protein
VAVRLDRVVRPSRCGNFEITADLSGQNVIDLGVSRNRAAPIAHRVDPPRMPTPLPQHHATVGAQVPNQLSALHRAMGSSI